jgi:hypothetical protein
MAKILLRTRNVGSPQASTSRASGSARHSFRNRVIGRGGMGFVFAVCDGKTPGLGAMLALRKHARQQ